jgi:hypothetical protein
MQSQRQREEPGPNDRQHESLLADEFVTMEGIVRTPVSLRAANGSSSGDPEHNYQYQNATKTR